MVDTGIDPVGAPGQIVDAVGDGGFARRGSNAYYPGLPLMQQYLENSWQRMSAFGYAVTQNPATAPANITGVGTLYNWGDVARYLAMLIGSLNLPQEGASGDWNHTEL